MAIMIRDIIKTKPNKSNMPLAGICFIYVWLYVVIWSSCMYVTCWYSTVLQSSLGNFVGLILRTVWLFCHISCCLSQGMNVYNSCYWFCLIFFFYKEHFILTCWKNRLFLIVRWKDVNCLRESNLTHYEMVKCE